MRKRRRTVVIEHNAATDGDRLPVLARGQVAPLLHGLDCASGGRGLGHPVIRSPIAASAAHVEYLRCFTCADPFSEAPAVGPVGGLRSGKTLLQ